MKKSVAQGRRKNQIHRAVLSALAISGGIAITAFAPNVLGILIKMGLTVSKRQGESIRAARLRLKSRGLLAEQDGRLELTAAGKSYLALATLREQSSNKPKRWDGKWRIIAFDIPHTLKTLRDKVRHMLLEIGFVRLQDSVWVFPYDCEEVIALIKTDTRAGKRLLYIIADAIEDDTDLRKHFKV